jgi:PKD repeat protein
MKQNYLFFGLFCALMLSFNALYAQTNEKKSNDIVYKSKVGPDGRVRCYTMEADSIRRALNPNLPTLQQEENWLQEQIRIYNEQQNAKVSKGQPKATVLTLPIVFHIITSGTGATNVAATWVQRQLDQLNIDYRDLAGSTNAAAGDCEIQFCLALRDPNNVTLTEPGIHRVTTYGAGPFGSTNFDNTIKPATIWDPTQYVNIWVGDLSGGLLGYAQFPSSSGLQGLNANGGSATTDGVVILHTSLGSVANPNPAGGQYGRGRTLTHELGHWLGLRHIWGDGSNCSATDFCADTPPASAANYGCPANQNSCTTDNFPDMIQNYMDYTDDACMNIFTNDQVTRVRTVMQVSPRRSTLASSTKCNSLAANDATISAIITPTGTICGLSFTPQVTLKNLGNANLTSCTITYNLDGGTNQTFNWTGSLTPNSTANITLNSFTSTAGNHVFNASTSSPNGAADGNPGNDALSSNFTLAVVTGVALPLTEGFTSTTFPPTNWTLANGGNTVTWARATVGTAPTTGNSAMMDNFTSSTTIAGDVDDLKTPALNLTGYTSATLTFDVAYARYNATYSDTLNVVVSTDCGQTWTTAYNKGGSTLATQADQTAAFNAPTSWRNETVDLSQFVGNNAVYVAFRNKSGWGQKLYLDNVNITGVNVTTPPTASFTSTPSNTACTGQTVQYTSTSTGFPTSYSWSFPGGTPATSTAQNPTVTYATAGSYNVSLTATNSLGSNTSNQTAYITVNTTPTLGATTPADRCGAGTLTLGASATSGTVNWYAAQTGGTALGTGTSWTTPSISATTTYYVEVTSNGCTSARTAVVATIKPIPTVNNPGNKTACIGATTTAINFTGSSNSSTYAWTNSNTGVGLAASGTGNIASFTPTSAGTAIISVTPTLNGCTGNPVSFSIVVTDCSAGIEEATDEFILIYPNPTSGLLTLKGETLNQYKSLELIDAAGRIVGNWTVNGNPLNLDLSSYAAGNYSLKLTGENTQTLKKIQIKK